MELDEKLARFNAAAKAHAKAVKAWGQAEADYVTAEARMDETRRAMVAAEAAMRGIDANGDGDG